MNYSKFGIKESAFSDAFGKIPTFWAWEGRREKRERRGEGVLVPNPLPPPTGCLPPMGVAREQGGLTDMLSLESHSEPGPQVSVSQPFFLFLSS